MYNKENIMDIINDHQKEIDELKSELNEIKSESIKKIVKDKIGNLEDNKYRYELQAKAWGVM